MKMKRKSFIMGVLFVAVAMFASNSAVSAEKIGMKELMAKFAVQPLGRIPILDFHLKDLDGNLVSMSSFLGKVILLNLWATWCPYCAKERPGLETLHQKFKDKGFTVVAISIDRQGAAVVRPYVEKHKLTFPQLLDPTSRIARDYFGLRGTPTNYLIDRAGNVVGGAIGFRDWGSPEAHRLIEHLLEEKTPSPGNKKEAKRDGKAG